MRMQAAFLKALSWFCHSTVRNRARGSVLDVTSSKETAAAVFLFCDFFFFAGGGEDLGPTYKCFR